MGNKKYDFNNLTKSFRALSNPLRFEIYITILETACECNLDKSGEIYGNCVTEIAKNLKLGQPTVSNLVKDLITADLIITKKKGKNTYLFGNPKFINQFQKFNSFVIEEISGH